ncbi:hypothetical protein VOLCADRAFT_108426 [Volvox carteri f. nagariensis]|uniref:Uncharacterized protein n=1 Tax=Volvox carteri f. nagariensis TaxID=3068 RepID=D8UK31_VOLCA|nr:uncharacterized protein VOLCADRAFT_108426 [Volvox carteri f. nagariensis]EFJ39925.1 hypothetical protein VOLCADRAFT_108426 [Volvox carteri f. nagariensis]|eukprot:XP_002959006.1 hypothetical protein VOLCADRAFT_108426 [Volvox carteri f. nagariensis]
MHDTVRPCAACLALNRNHQLKRSADAASLRVAATQRVATDPSVIVPFRSAEGLERAGHVELFERLKVVTSALIAERADRIALDREIKRRTSLFQAARVRLQAYARADASRSELVRLLETSQQRGMMQCRHARQLINPRKMMMIGPYLISFPALRALSKRMPHVNISSQDLNYKDKQNQRATLKLADLDMDPSTGSVKAVSVLRDALETGSHNPVGGDGPIVDGSYYATFLYVTFMHYLVAGRMKAGSWSLYYCPPAFPDYQHELHHPQMSYGGLNQIASQHNSARLPTVPMGKLSRGVKECERKRAGQ